MAKKTSYKLQPPDEQIVHVFTDLGMPKNLAKTLMYISHVDECRSAEIERGANLRQPEVSIAMQHLQDKGWIEKRELKKKGKGRPVHLYSLKAPLPTIIKNFEQEKLREVEAVKRDLSSLKLLIEEK